eukprot:1045814-Amphidinium_carterae.1
MHARVQLCMTPAAMFTSVLHHSINVSSIIALRFFNISAGTNVLCTKHNNWRKDRWCPESCDSTGSQEMHYQRFLQFVQTLSATLPAKD